MTRHPEINGLRTWIEIDRPAVADNYKQLRGLLGSQTKFMAVVKSNAYGHSLLDFSQEVERLGVDCFGVDSIVEAEALWEAGIKIPILVLGYTLPIKYKDAAEKNIALTISSAASLAEIARFSRKISIHIKVDTGMHRQGFLSKEIPETVSMVKALPENINVEGLFTHFASAKDPASPQSARSQMQEFSLWREAFAEAGLQPMIHASASGVAIIYPEFHFDMVRFGAAMYGIWPSAEIKSSSFEKLPLKPLLNWRTMISEIKEVPAGESVGYDFTERLERDSRLAICPIGYWHGLPLAVSRVGEVLVEGQPAKIVGRVSMDMIVIDVTDIPESKVGSRVTVLGRDGDAEILPENLAEKANSSSYEVITRINPLIKRIFV